MATVNELAIFLYGLITLVNELKEYSTDDVPFVCYNGVACSIVRAFHNRWFRDMVFAWWQEAVGIG